VPKQPFEEKTTWLIEKWCDTKGEQPRHHVLTVITAENIGLLPFDCRPETNYKFTV